MNVCIDDWNGTERCLSHLQFLVQNISAPGQIEAGAAIAVLLLVVVGVFIFKNPA